MSVKLPEPFGYSCDLLPRQPPCQDPSHRRLYTDEQVAGMLDALLDKEYAGFIIQELGNLAAALREGRDG